MASDGAQRGGWVEAKRGKMGEGAEGAAETGAWKTTRKRPRLNTHLEKTMKTISRSPRPFSRTPSWAHGRVARQRAMPHALPPIPHSSVYGQRPVVLVRGWLPTVAVLSPGTWFGMPPHALRDVGDPWTETDGAIVAQTCGRDEGRRERRGGEKREDRGESRTVGEQEARCQCRAFLVVFYAILLYSAIFSSKTGHESTSKLARCKNRRKTKENKGKRKEGGGKARHFVQCIRRVPPSCNRMQPHRHTRGGNDRPLAHGRHRLAR